MKKKKPNVLAKKIKTWIMFSKKSKYFDETQWCWHTEVKNQMSHAPVHTVLYFPLAKCLLQDSNLVNLDS